ncbi:hypothetical protein GCM10009100_25390 [Thalassospira tepidiphila]
MSMEQWQIDAFAAAIRQSAEPGFELSGFAPYTPVTVSSKTIPLREVPQKPSRLSRLINFLKRATRANKPT